MTDMRTPLRRVRGLGSTASGTEHFWQQRLTAVANLFLISFFVILVIALHNESYADVRAAFANPLVGIAMALVTVSAAIHMKIGMQVIIEDYVHGGMKVLLVIFNTFFAVAIAGASLFAIVKMSFGV
ncbi:succinate dehydrogenase, hydrophobic membrane anchor protein [Aurantimonas sp. C2-6-R+9]|uniref:succinate dehydrogenase, hydrophobic membrane anchor protein n=1 Tax=unclassified Aurantimonas TaxID=2638230 RepID=UPI002E17EB88|nr:MULTISPECIES: succinate dehydrogenase, hydrophobic membrane anchor protein [unclassified Aurantimonas]MEC5289692.1 succinate dehydrogenase, hydrophobic membrane anchor protein [Aurantimonas sp. C2-3-R2]MEC5379658.1 succinate dehydrogenase, hydrophobic membrane anchor protein [Aurantimonas sp. C2-6-R+9]MEC5410871.1 succinate dehydrogenase, hydrophobic membrane anchor protein [Aurantimonas sp. C2-4-R8]